MYGADYLSWNKVQCNDGAKMRSVKDIRDVIYKLVRRKT